MSELDRHDIDEMRARLDDLERVLTVIDRVERELEGVHGRLMHMEEAFPSLVTMQALADHRHGCGGQLTDRPRLTARLHPPFMP